MAHHRWHEQNDNQSRQQPDRADNEIAWQRQINCADRQKGEQRISKWLGGIVAILLIAAAVFLTNLIWFRPWNLNLFFDKVFAEVLFDHPELLSMLGLVEQFGITSHNGKLDDESPAHQQREFDR